MSSPDYCSDVTMPVVQEMRHILAQEDDEGKESINMISETEPAPQSSLSNTNHAAADQQLYCRSARTTTTSVATRTSTTTMAITMPDRSSTSNIASSKKMRTASPPLAVVAQGGGRLNFGRSSPPTTNNSPSSDFSLDLMPVDKIQKRTLYPWSVHHSLATSKWVATIARPSLEGTSNSSTSSSSSNNKLRYVQFIFQTEREANKFCKTYAPPKLLSASNCVSCKKVGNFRYCRNCGAACCDPDSARWGTRMLPRTYMPGPGSAVVRVCKACDWLSNAFCMALLQGRAHDAMQLYETGNINLRTCFADIHREAMFPVHCAVMGGSLECLKWLVDTQMCPISAKVDPKTQQPLSVQTSGSRTLLDLAMTGRPKIDILTFLVSKGLSITDMKHSDLALKTLEVILKSPAATPATLFQQTGVELHFVHDDNNMCRNGGGDNQSVATMTAIEDACNICFERNMDCVLTPCGHQVCCTECGIQLDKCPICKAPCSFLKIFRQ